MKAFWSDQSTNVNVSSAQARPVILNEALDIWADLSGMEGNFFGLIDDRGRVMQLYFDDGIPNHVDDASDLKIVWAEFPIAERKGSLGVTITCGEASAWIKQVFEHGADPQKFSGLKFESW